jgi:integrase/recombinase XerD
VIVGDVVRRRRRIVVGGPLAPFAEGLRGELAGQGYSTDTITEHVRLLADLSDWLSAQDLSTFQLTDEALQEFLRARRAAGRRVGVSGRAFAPILGFLRGLEVVPPSTVVAPTTPQEALLVEYRRYLEDERGLAASTVVHYLRCARQFLAWLPGSLTRSLPALSAGQVIEYVRDWSSRRKSTTIDMVNLPALRSLLRYLHVTGLVPNSLAGAVPAGRGRLRNAVARAASSGGVRAVLAGSDRLSAAGRRDYAILLTLARLAVRGGEVARLQLSDVNWRAAELTIRGKAGRVDVLPLPADVGAAMADYLLRARPSTVARTLFVTVKAPFTGLCVSAVTDIVARACAVAGVPRFGPHGIRHAAACDLLAKGASMEEIGQLLRHAQQRTTAIYARLDQGRLAELAMPCPQGVAR